MVNEVKLQVVEMLGYDENIELKHDKLLEAIEHILYSNIQNEEINEELNNAINLFHNSQYKELLYLLENYFLVEHFEHEYQKYYMINAISYILNENDCKHIFVGDLYDSNRAAFGQDKKFNFPRSLEKLRHA